MEGLQHMEVCRGPFGSLVGIKNPIGCYMYHAGDWYEARQPKGHANVIPYRVKPEEVPREIRTLCLLLIN